MYDAAANLTIFFTSKPVEIQKIEIDTNDIETKQIKSILEN